MKIGVDLGTTWTAAAVQRDGSVETLSLGTQTAAMPSVVAVDGEQIVAGEAAERKLLAEPASGVRECKRRLGDTTPMVMGGKPYGPEALLGHLLRHVVAAATEDGGASEAVVLTHPANWGGYKLDLLREAGRLAGVGEVTLVPEPVAAASHYVTLGRLNPGDTVAVYDFGGTFDAAVVRCTESGAEILGTPEGLERMGGVDLDQLVLAHVDGALGGALRELDTTDAEIRKGVVRLRAECTAAKEALSTDTEATVSVMVPGLNTQVRITREEFEAAVRPRIADTLGALERAVASAGISADQLAGVLLVGGSSRIPVVAEEVGRLTGRPTLLDADPKLVVALGAAAGGSIVMAAPKKTDDTNEKEADASAAAAAAAPVAPAIRRTAPQKERVAKGDKGSASGAGVAAGLGVAAAGVAAAGYAATQLLGDDDPDVDGALATAIPTDAPADDDSLDAFDDVVSGGSGGGGGRAFGGGGGGGGGRHFVDDGPGTMAPPPPPADTGDPLDGIRAQLRDRLANWDPPEGADPDDVADLRSELEGLINRYHVQPGQSVDDALADLRQQFDDQVEDFVQDVKIDRVIEEQQQENSDEAAQETPPDRPGYDWVPAQDGVPGHWERERAGMPNDEQTDEYDDPGPNVIVRDHRGDDGDGGGGVTVRDHRGRIAQQQEDQPDQGDGAPAPAGQHDRPLPDVFDDIDTTTAPQPTTAEDPSDTTTDMPDDTPDVPDTPDVLDTSDDALGIDQYQTATADTDLGVASGYDAPAAAVDTAPADMGSGTFDAPDPGYIADPAPALDPTFAAVGVDLDQPADFVADDTDFDTDDAGSMDDDTPSPLDDDNDPTN